jgi:hypothetical protein
MSSIIFTSTLNGTGSSDEDLAFGFAGGTALLLDLLHNIHTLNNLTYACD